MGLRGDTLRAAGPKKVDPLKQVIEGRRGDADMDDAANQDELHKNRFSDPLCLGAGDREHSLKPPRRRPTVEPGMDR